MTETMGSTTAGMGITSGTKGASWDRTDAVRDFLGATPDPTLYLDVSDDRERVRTGSLVRLRSSRDDITKIKKSRS